jgi:hypothetical protein
MYEATISEARRWTVAGSDDTWVGVCIPDRHQILIRPSSGGIEWPSAGLALSTDLTRGLSDELGAGDGEMLLPISFDASVDSRVYVLEAGNARVQVFAP